MIRLNIRETARLQGINQSQLQIKSGVTPQLLNRYWNNKVESVGFEALTKIAKALGVDPRNLLTIEEEKVSA